jgi:hypothetical protein
MNRPPGILARIYHLILHTYPPEYHETFGDEMYLTFLEGVSDARSQGNLLPFMLRELRDLPGVLANAYMLGWKRKWQEGIKILREATSPTGLPPPPPDGRESWRQACLEISLFLLAGLFFVLATYLPFDGLRPAWQRDLGFLGKFIVPLTLLVFLLGLVRGLPRWAYPFGGLLLGFQVLALNQSGLLPFLIVMLLSSLILGIAALISSPHLALFPVTVRRIGQSLSIDRTRLSFGIYGAVPLAILLAFNDAHADNRTPYFALAVLVMVAGALIYSRSRQRTIQIGALLSGMSLAIWASLLDKAAIAGSSGDWISRQYPGTAEVVWLLQLWVPWLIFILVPALLRTPGQAVKLNRAVE